MATIKAIAFAARVRAAATALEIAYRMAVRIRDEWVALNMVDDIPNDATVISDGVRPLTGAAIRLVIAACNALIAEYEANGKQGLYIVVRASDAPADWR